MFTGNCCAVCIWNQMLPFQWTVNVCSLQPPDWMTFLTWSVRDQAYMYKCKIAWAHCLAQSPWCSINYCLGYLWFKIYQRAFEISKRLFWVDKSLAGVLPELYHIAVYASKRSWYVCLFTLRQPPSLVRRILNRNKSLSSIFINSELFLCYIWFNKYNGCTVFREVVCTHCFKNGTMYVRIRKQKSKCWFFK